MVYYNNTAQKWSFTIRIFSVNVTKSAFTEEILNEKLHFLCSVTVFTEGGDLLDPQKDLLADL